MARPDASPRPGGRDRVGEPALRARLILATVAALVVLTVVVAVVAFATHEVALP